MEGPSALRLSNDDFVPSVNVVTDRRPRELGTGIEGEAGRTVRPRYRILDVCENSRFHEELLNTRYSISGLGYVNPKLPKWATEAGS